MVMKKVLRTFSCRLELKKKQNKKKYLISYLNALIYPNLNKLFYEFLYIKLKGKPKGNLFLTFDFFDKKSKKKNSKLEKK